MPIDQWEQKFFKGRCSPRCHCTWWGQHYKSCMVEEHISLCIYIYMVHTQKVWMRMYVFNDYFMDVVNRTGVEAILNSMEAGHQWLGGDWPLECRISGGFYQLHQTVWYLRETVGKTDSFSWVLVRSLKFSQVILDSHGLHVGKKSRRTYDQR